MERKRIVLGVSGASGAGIAVRIAAILGAMEDVELHLVVTAAAERTLAHETGPEGLRTLEEAAYYRHPIQDIGATIASGSFHTAGMIVAPASMHTTSAIAAGLANNLLTRAADVHLKERRRLVLIARESPLHLGHLRAMTAVTEYGAIVAPPVPAFYLAPQTTAEIIDQIARRAIDLLALDLQPLAACWSGTA